jgi:hypothetical protein
MDFGYRRGNALEYVAVIVVSILGIAYADVVIEAHALLVLLANLLLVAMLCAFIWRGLWDKRPALRLSREGIWFRGWRSTAPLPWSAIRRIRITERKYICFELKDASTILSQPEFAYVQRWARVNTQMAGSPFTIGAVVLSATPAELMARLAEWLERSRRRH